MITTQQSRPAAYPCLVTVAALLISFSGWAQPVGQPRVEPGPEALTNTLAQIEALQKEAQALSPAQKKIATSLLEALRESRGEAPRAYAPKVRSDQKLLPGNRIVVDLRAKVSERLLAFLRTQGAMIQSSHPQYASIRAEIPIAALERLAGDPDVSFIRPAAQAFKNAGSATSEGVYAETADKAQANGVTGAGVKVGVLSDSLRYLANSQANGDLGTVNYIVGQTGVGTNNDEGEGTAMLEIVHDMAPDAVLYFATGFGGEASMAANILALANDGCSIIIDDVTYQDESPFSANQPIAQAVKTVSDSGVLYFSSAANSGSFARGTSGTWTGNFTTYGADPKLGQLHDWGGTPYNQITSQNGAVTLFWSDPLGGATNDYNLFITDSKGNILRQSITLQNGANDPYESVAASTNSGEYVVVALFSGVQRDIYVGTGRGRLAHGTSGNTRGHNAAPAANAFCIAASSARGIGPGTTFTGGYTTHVENFSSDGFPRLFYETDGSAVTPNDLTASGGRTLLKPDLTAADDVVASSKTFGTLTIFTPFTGTSAAAPHAGAVAALLRSYRPDLTAAQVRNALTGSALDIESLGFDNASGAGIIMAQAALVRVDNTPPQVAVNSPANGAVVGALSAIAGTASDTGSGLLNNQVQFTLYNNGNFWTGTYWTNTSAGDPTVQLNGAVVNGKWSYTAVPPDPGTYYVSAFARDNAYNTSAAQSGVTSTSFQVYGTTPPQVAITNPTDGTVLSGSLPPISGTTSDDHGVQSLSLYIIRLSDNTYWDGTAWGGGGSAILPTSVNSVSHNWVSTGGLPVIGGTDPRTQMVNGNYDLIAIAYDAAGNQARSDSIVNVNNHPTYTYTGQACCPQPPATPGDPQDWFDGRNWSPNGVPGSTDIAIIDGFSVNFGPAVVVEGLTLRSGSLTGGSLGFNPADAGNGLVWQGGTLACNPTIQANGQLTISGGADKQLNGGSLINLGKATWLGSGNLIGFNGATITNMGVFEIENDQTFTYCCGGGSPTFVNLPGAILRKSIATGVSSFASFALLNSGVIDIQSGVLSLTSLAHTFTDGSDLRGAGRVRVDGTTVNLYGNITLESGAIFELAAGTLTGSNTFRGPGTFTWSGGSLSGSVAIAPDANLSITGSSDKVFNGGAIQNAGRTTWTGAGTFLGFNGAALTNTGVFDIQTDAAMSYCCGGSLASFINQGIVTKEGASGTNIVGFIFNNDAVMNVQAGAIALAQGGTSSGTFSNAAGSKVEFTGGVQTLNAGVRLSGAGSDRINGGTITLNGDITLDSGATLELAQGTLQGTGAFKALGTFAWTAIGSTTLAANLSIAPGAIWLLSGEASNMQLSGGHVLNSGTALWTGTGDLIGYNGGTITNLGVFEMHNDQQFTYCCGGSAPAFNNLPGAILRKSGASGVTSFGSFTLLNAGIVDMQSGTLSLTTVAHTFTDGSDLRGTGRVRVDGTTVSLFGNITLEAGTTFELAAGTLNGSNTFRGPGTFTWSGGSLSGSVAIAPDANLGITGSSDKVFNGGAIQNAGRATWMGTGTLFGFNGAALANTGVFDIQTDAAMSYCCGGGLATFINQGIVTKEGASGTNIVSFSFANNGVMNVQAGAIALAQGGTSSGTFSNAAGGKVEFTGGVQTLNPGARLSGAGSGRINGGTITLNGDITLDSGTTLELAQGTLQGSGAFKGVGTFAWTAIGATTLAADLSIATGTTWLLSGAASNMQLNGGHVLNSGTALWTGTGDLMGYNGGAITNLGVFEMRNDQQFTYCCGGLAPTFNNLPGAILRKSGATGVTSFGSFTLLNAGIVDMQSGILSLTTVTHTFTDGSDLRGPGRVRVDGTTASLYGNITLEIGATLELAAGTVNGTNTFLGPGTFVWSGGSLTGSLNVGPTANLSLSGTADKQLAGGALNNNGTATWTGTGNLLVYNGGALTNSGVFEMSNNANLDYCCGGPPGTFHNQPSGILRKTLATGNSTIGNINFTNEGTLDLRIGSATVSGAYAPSPASQLKLTLGGSSAGTQFSQLTIGGAAALAGTLSVALANGFTPTNGSAFAIVNYGSLASQFSVQQLPALPGLRWQLDYGTSSLTLRVLPGTPVIKVFQNAGWAANGTFGFDIVGPASGSAIVWMSTNWANWDPIYTNSPFTGSISFNDPNAHEYPHGPMRVYTVKFLK